MKKEIRDGFILRSLSEGVSSDAQNLGQFYVEIFGDEGDEDAETILPWTEDLISGNHPTVTLDDVWVVVDPSQDDRIISALLLIPQTWRYETIELGVGRVELVATHKDYRRRGLIRELMTVAHERSASLGHVMQSIGGIRHYYRQFGYAMAIDLGGDSHIPLSVIPKLKDDQTTTYTLRPAVTSDIENLQAWEAYDQRAGGISLKREWKHWDYDLNHRNVNSALLPCTNIVVNAEGQDVGFVSFILDKYYSTINIWHWIIGDQSSYYDTFDDILRAIQTATDKFFAPLPDDKYPTLIHFDNGISPALKSLIHRTNGKVASDRVYMWYLRVDDLPVFIKLIAPVLEQRLEGSGMNRFTGDLKIGLYEVDRIEIMFEDGKITDVITADVGKGGSDASFPYHTFLNVLFGHRDWLDLTYILPEVHANRKADMLLTVLFPKMRSHVSGGIV